MSTFRESEPLAASALSASAIAACSALTLTAIVMTGRVMTRLAEKRCEGGIVVTAAGLDRACSSRLVRLIPWALTELHLARLDLQDADLNPKLSCLSGLRRVDLSYNKLVTFPPQLLSLKRLLELNLAHNEIRRLPTGISRLRRLQRLNLMCNKLEGVLPEGLGALDALMSLGLKGNAITALNQSLGGCVSLVELYITDNQLQVIFSDITHCAAQFFASFEIVICMLTCKICACLHCSFLCFHVPNRLCHLALVSAKDCVSCKPASTV
jgi:Leucine-rich repeat (LRR) protein